MPGTGMPLDWLVERMEQCKAMEKILLLDVVHAGNGADLAQQPSNPVLLSKLKTPLATVVVIANSSADERGTELTNERHGLFGRAVADGFAGEADDDRDLKVTVKELVDHVKKRLATAKLPEGVKQTPYVLNAKGNSP